jgi:arabinan endo-1,5-alpha-L-arabinosidase
MLRTLCIALWLLFPHQLIDRSALHVRDPFILHDPVSGSYYLYANSRPHFKVYKSDDLRQWKDMGYCFTAAPDFWGKRDFWAPDVYHYRGRYYLFATFGNDTIQRGTSILVADRPTGPFEPLENRPVTPEKWMCLDGSLYVDDQQQPWIIYSREWLQVKQGQVLAQRLSPDLRRTAGAPQLLFTADKAAWTGTVSSGGVTGYVTDAPFIYKAHNGELLMLWSSFTKEGKYAIGLARSANGRITGPWSLDVAPLNNDDGGHAMLFESAGKLMISYHAPNSKTERPVIYPVQERKGRLSIVR